MSNFWLADVITGVYTSFAPCRVRPHERIQEFLKGVGEPGGGGEEGRRGCTLTLGAIGVDGKRSRNELLGGPPQHS